MEPITQVQFSLSVVRTASYKEIEKNELFCIFYFEEPPNHSDLFIFLCRHSIDVFISVVLMKKCN